MPSIRLFPILAVSPGKLIGRVGYEGLRKERARYISGQRLLSRGLDKVRIYFPAVVYLMYNNLDDLVFHKIVPVTFNHIGWNNYILGPAINNPGCCYSKV